MKEKIENILGKKLQVTQQSPLTFTCPDFGSTYNVAQRLVNSDLQFGFLIRGQVPTVQMQILKTTRKAA